MDPQMMRSLASLFDGVPHTMFCVKESHGAYEAVNQAFAERAGRRNPAEVVGLTAHDLYSESVADQYVAQDLAVMASGQPIRAHLELVRRPTGAMGWYLTNKVLVGKPHD